MIRQTTDTELISKLNLGSGPHDESAVAEVLQMAEQAYPGRISLATSFGAEDQVLTDIVCRLAPNIGIFTLDTGRLPQETFDTLDATQQRYDIKIKVLFPDPDQVRRLYAETGPNGFYESIENRRRCCQVRKVEPLKRELAKLGAWVTGLRRQQSLTRESLPLAQWDELNGLVKISPLADWTWRQVWDHIRRNNVPYNRLHDRGYPSIGCAPCTRAIAEGEDMRSGRWWWESPAHKECGLHVGNSTAAEKAGRRK